jgi:hypothetical protein
VARVCRVFRLVASLGVGGLKASVESWSGRRRLPRTYENKIGGF